MRPQSGKAYTNRYNRNDRNEHLGYNEARYSGGAYYQDRNRDENEWNDADGYNNYRNAAPPRDYRQEQQRYHDHYSGNDSTDYNEDRDRRHHTPNGNGYIQGQRNRSREWDEDINADRSIQGSRNYMREEHAYGQSNDSMYEEHRGKRHGRQNYQNDYNYNNKAQYPYRANLAAYDTDFNNPENFRKAPRRGYGSRYKQ